jgi:hypothetical protein
MACVDGLRVEFVGLPLSIFVLKSLIPLKVSHVLSGGRVNGNPSAWVKCFLLRWHCISCSSSGCWILHASPALCVAITYAKPFADLLGLVCACGTCESTWHDVRLVVWWRLQSLVFSFLLAPVSLVGRSDVVVFVLQLHAVPVLISFLLDEAGT